ncbi:hypothetical protein DFH11DRAFT_215353 [Phellopilus nigrolimitatus]|nr:hypothetical protein DFH11DRAFT_215353 [Phellopilus nigrolimitatus]
MLGRCKQNMPTEPGHAKSRSRATASPVETTDSEVESKPWAQARTPSSSSTSRGSSISPSRLSIPPEPTSGLKAALARTAASLEGYASEGSRARNYLKFKRSAPSARSCSVSDLQSAAKTEETRDIRNGSGFRVFHSPLAGKPMTMENPVSGPQVQRPPDPPSSYANVKHRSHFSAEPLSSSSPSTKASCFDNPAAHSFPWRNSPRSSTESDMKERRPSTASGVMEGRFSRDPAQTHVPNVQKNTQPLPETSQVRS